jgi:lipoate---protein ligase
VNVFVSPFNNPFLNLALEDYFLRSPELLPVCLFYVNRPCVVLGRFQNPWKECQLPYLVENDIWMVRRQSGGGCVYHDEGNLNFSFILPDASIDRRKHCELLQRAFAKSEIRLQISERHDLWVENSENEWRKVSGSAFKQTKAGSFHHGTFLVTSDLERLEEALRHTIIPKDSKSIPSVRSRVATLNEKYPGLEIQDVIELVAFELKSEISMVDAAILSQPILQESFRKFTSEEWLWNETPAFTYDSLQGPLLIRKGKVESPVVQNFSRELMVPYFSRDELENIFPDFSDMAASSQVIF